MSQYLQILLISAVLAVLGTAKPASSEFDDDKIQALRRLLLVDLRALDGDLMPDEQIRPLNVESGERLQKRRLVMGMPNILHMGNKRMVKRMVERNAQREVVMNKRRISMHMPNLVYMRPQK